MEKSAKRLYLLFVNLVNDLWQIILNLSNDEQPRMKNTLKAGDAVGLCHLQTKHWLAIKDGIIGGKNVNYPIIDWRIVSDSHYKGEDIHPHESFLI